MEEKCGQNYRKIFLNLQFLYCDDIIVRFTFLHQKKKFTVKKIFRKTKVILKEKKIYLALENLT